MFSFLNRLSLHKPVAEPGTPARLVLDALLRELPDLLLACVVEVASGNVLAYYTSQANYSPHHVSLRYARLLQQPYPLLASNPLADITTVLEEHLHHLRPLYNGAWYCFVAVRITDVNLALLREVVRRCTTLAVLQQTN